MKKRKEKYIIINIIMIILIIILMNMVLADDLKCSDSDLTNFYTKGVVTYGNETFRDYCVDEYSLIENYCSKNNPLTISSNCRYGCLWGACQGPIIYTKLNCTEANLGKAICMDNTF